MLRNVNEENNNRTWNNLELTSPWIGYCQFLNNYSTVKLFMFFIDEIWWTLVLRCFTSRPARYLRAQQGSCVPSWTLAHWVGYTEHVFALTMCMLKLRIEQSKAVARKSGCGQANCSDKQTASRDIWRIKYLAEWIK